MDTVYASVGRKPQMLLAVHDAVLGGGEPVPAEQRDYVRAVREADGARAKIAVYAEALGRLLPGTVPIAEALRVAGQTDADCRAVREGLDERRAAQHAAVRRRPARPPASSATTSPTTTSPTWCGR